MQIKPIHPFPARMAPDVAISRLRDLAADSTVLDPMAGSGTVVRHATELGHRAIGFDLDPLAVLMTRVWTTPVSEPAVERMVERILSSARNVSPDANLPWIDNDSETRSFVDFWFAPAQQADLRRLAYATWEIGGRRLRHETRDSLNLVRLALSRIIITKESGASLARDVSHSRPHKVAKTTDFDVFSEFERSVAHIRKLLREAPPVGHASVDLGDSRSMRSIANESVDAVITSPPYLNAIDYMRGHRMSLVWLGYSLAELRAIRSNNIGAERGPDSNYQAALFDDIRLAMVPDGQLTMRHTRMVARYAEDVYRLMSETRRVLKPHGKAILIVGNSCLKGAFIRNSEGVVRAAQSVGLTLSDEAERDLPVQSRYLPMPTSDLSALGKRMRTETILTFNH